jgi:hypothetical protein
MTSMSPDAGLSPGGASAVGAVASAAGPAVGGVHTADVLAFTGTGPGTFYLAIIGFVSLIAGFVATRLGRAKPAVAQAPVNGLADLAPLADHLHETR